MDKVKAIRLVQSGLTVEMHLASGVQLTSNVSREADAAFLAELKRSDCERYNRLVNAMQRQAYRNLPKAA